MRDPDVRKFLLWAASILLMFWTIGYGLNAAIILVVPEPLPDLASETADATWLAWDLHREAGQKDMLNQLQRRVDGIMMVGLLESGMNPFGASATARDCDNYELVTANTGESRSTGGGVDP